MRSLGALFGVLGLLSDVAIVVGRAFVGPERALAYDTLGFTIEAFFDLAVLASLNLGQPL